MKEMKFRAYHIGEQKMYTDICVMFCPGELREFRIFTASDGEFIGNDKHFEQPQVFIGLKDKNGKEIYDGDIICNYENENHKVIKYLDDCASFGVANIKDLKHELWLDIWQIPSKKWWEDFLKKYEVVGNIYENPELLKKII